jgi:hypothetical protein
MSSSDDQEESVNTKQQNFQRPHDPSAKSVSAYASVPQLTQDRQIERAGDKTAMRAYLLRLVCIVHADAYEHWREEIVSKELQL